MTSGRVLAVDPGTVNIGLALSDEGRMIAQPLETLPAQPESTLVARLLGIVERVGASELVVGLPRRMDGAEGPEARSARALGTALRRHSGLRVTMVDERLSSAEAERMLLAQGHRRAARRRMSDPVAASLILSTFLAGPRGRA